jgi:hypothetical protein
VLNTIQGKERSGILSGLTSFILSGRMISEVIGRNGNDMGDKDLHGRSAMFTGGKSSTISPSPV